MKYLILGLSLLSLLLAFCFWSGSSLSTRFCTVIEPLKQAQRAARNGDFKAARQLSETAFTSWKQNYRSLAACLDHSDIDDVSYAFAGLLDAPEQDYLPSCSALLALLTDLMEADALTLHNLL